MIVQHIVSSQGGCIIDDIHASFYRSLSVCFSVLRKLNWQRDKTVYKFLGLTLMFGK